LVNLGGSLGREQATGRGTAIVTREACKAFKIDLKKATVAVQGFGNVGSWTVRFLAEMGAKIVAVSDVHGGIFKPEGLDVEALYTHFKSTDSVVGFEGTRPIDNAELLTLDVDILVPAALGGAIGSENAEAVQAKLVIEAANSPVTPAGDEILHRRGVHVVPDILVNAGGVTVSYFEWVQNLQQLHWELSHVNEELEKRMVAAWQNVHEKSTDSGVPMRMAAYMVALDKVAEATRMRV